MSDTTELACSTVEQIAECARDSVGNTLVVLIALLFVFALMAGLADWLQKRWPK